MAKNVFERAFYESHSQAGLITEENLGEVLFLRGVNCLFCIVHLLCTLGFVLCTKQTMGSVLARWISISSPKWRLVDAYPAKRPVANYYNNPRHHRRISAGHNFFSWHQWSHFILCEINICSEREISENASQIPKLMKKSSSLKEFLSFFPFHQMMR